MRVLKNPDIVVKRLLDRVGALNPETTELFVLDAFASCVLSRILDSPSGADTAELSSADVGDESEVEEVVSFLLDRRVILEC